MQLSPVQARFFDRCAKEILSVPLVRSMKQYVQHGKTNCLCHCIMVARESYALALWLHRTFGWNIRYRAIIRAALLHDFFLYDWHDPHNGHRFHGFSHPYTAYQQASKYFFLNKREKDIIQKHMFPFTPFPPRYLESWIVCVADKICSLRETLARNSPVNAGQDCPLSLPRPHLSAERTSHHVPASL